jgi:serine/threonine protein kinase
MSEMECMRDSFQDGVLFDGRFQSVKLLNHGSFGMVYLAKDILRNELVAVKCLLKPGSPAAASYGLSVDELSQELETHSRLGSHPNIVNLIHSFETECHQFLVLEYCPMGDLYEAIRLGRGPLETEHVRDFMLQLVAAVEHMHSRGVYHRDIKPENIFLSQDGKVKVGDFGLATTEEWSEERAVGSDRYMAPEQYDCLGGGYLPEQADIWAIGICLLNILFARNPFVTPTEDDPLFADFILDPESLFDVFPTLSYDTYEVLLHSLALEPKKRSLAKLREAIERVVSWTTDDESLDDYCAYTAEEREIVAAPANREPLRTPSIQSPQIDNGACFPWAQALEMSPPQRQLSAIPDEEPTIRYSENMFANNPERYASDMGFHLPASYDSGLGASLSTLPKAFNLRSENIHIGKPAATETTSLWGKTNVPASGSWSDWVDEDEEEEERERIAREKELKRRSWSYESDPGYGDSEDDGYDAEWVGGGWEDLTV